MFSGRICQVVYGHFDVVTCLTRSECNIAQDCYVVTGSKDCTVMVWLWSSRGQAVVGENASKSPHPSYLGSFYVTVDTKLLLIKVISCGIGYNIINELYMEY